MQNEPCNLQNISLKCKYTSMTSSETFKIHNLQSALQLAKYITCVLYLEHACVSVSCIIIKPGVQPTIIFNYSNA